MLDSTFFPDSFVYLERNKIAFGFMNTKLTTSVSGTSQLPTKRYSKHKPKTKKCKKSENKYEACSIFWFSNYIIPLLSCTHCVIANCTSGFVVTSKKYLQVQQESSKVVRSPAESSSLGSSKTKSIQLCMRHIICICE